MVRATSVKCPTSGSFKYRLTKVVLEHNHPVSEAVYMAYPENRRPQITDTVESLLSCPSVANLDVRMHVEQTQWRTMLFQDVRNMKLQLSSNCDDRAKVDLCISSLKEQGGDVEYGMDLSSSFQYLVYVSKHMKNLLERYPDVLLMDASYKTNYYLLPLVTVMCIDSYGKGHLVMHAFVRHEDKDLLARYLEFFASTYDCAKTTTFFVDKDLSEIAAINHVFPSADVCLCRFHIKQSIKRNLHGKGISSYLSASLQDLFDRQSLALTEEEFSSIGEEIRSLAPPPLIAYFQNNWWNCPQMWALYKNLDVPQLHVTTTNHLESYHSKIKAMLHSKMGLAEVLDYLVRYDNHLVQASITNNTATEIKTHFSSRNTDPIIGHIYKDLTSFAAKHVIHQYNISKKVTYSVFQLEDNMYRLQSQGDSVHRTTEDSYSCKFFVILELQCRHMFVLRAHLSQTLYKTVTSGHRFSRGSLFNSTNDQQGIVSVQAVEFSHKTLSLEEKFNAADKLMKQYSSYLSLLGTNAFKDKMRQMEVLLKHWKNNEEVNFLFDVVEVPGTSSSLLPECLMPVEESLSSSSVPVPPASSSVPVPPSLSSVPVPPASSSVPVPPASSSVPVLPSSSSVPVLPSSSSVPVLPSSSSVPVLPPSSSSSVPVPPINLEPGEETLSVPSLSSFCDVNLVRVKTKGHPRIKQRFTCRKRKCHNPRYLIV